MKTKFEGMRGFRDIYPNDSEIRDHMFSTAKSVARSFGYKIIDFPSLELLDLYRVKSGEELLGQTFSFMDKGGREVTMIPEATPSVVRMLTAKKDLPKPVRWFCLPKLWRYEEPQSGRVREHVQFNADIFGPDTPEADSENVGLACTILDSLGLAGNYEVRINHRKLMEKLLHSAGARDIPHMLPLIDRYRKMSPEDFRAALMDAGLNQSSVAMLDELLGSGARPGEVRTRIEKYVEVDGDLAEIIDRMEATMMMISKYTESRIIVDFATVRGLGYYTGMVFEAFDIKGELRSILGGGRYDNLSSLIADQNVPAIGFGMGDVVLELLLRRVGLWTVRPDFSKYYVCNLVDGTRQLAVDLAIEMRKSGAEVISDLGGHGLSGQLKTAASMGCHYAVIIGKNEIESGTLTLRNLDTGEQKSIQKRALLDGIKGEP